MDLGLKENVAIIAASSKGLGFSVAHNLVVEGAKVVINGRGEKTLHNAQKKLSDPKNVRSFAGDVTRKTTCKNLMEFAYKEFGQIDILVTNCGGPDAGLFEHLTSEQWQAAIGKSLLSHIYLIQYALPYLKKSRSPSILTITSFTVKQPASNLMLSNSIRAATVGLTKSLANEFGSLGIRVNSILPGWTMTERVESLLKSRSDSNNTSVDKEKEKIIQSIPLARMAIPDEFGKVAAFLVSPAASYITGAMLNVDGGINQGLF